MSFTSVVLSFVLCSLACRDYADDISVFALAVANQEQPRDCTCAQPKAAILIGRVVFSESLNSEVVMEDSLVHFKGDLVLLGV